MGCEYLVVRPEYATHTVRFSRRVQAMRKAMKPISHKRCRVFSDALASEDSDEKGLRPTELAGESGSLSKGARTLDAITTASSDGFRTVQVSYDSVSKGWKTANALWVSGAAAPWRGGSSSGRWQFLPL